MKLPQRDGFHWGYNEITSRSGAGKESMMDFGVLQLGNGMTFDAICEEEWALVLLHGTIEVTIDGLSYQGERKSSLSDKPWSINLSGHAHLTVRGMSEKSETAVIKTENSCWFDPVVRCGDKITSEMRGAGLMQEAATRLIRMVNDKNIAPKSNLVIGEDVQFPGRWAGFPPHSHPQPEIYFYKFYPENGFGLMRHGQDGVLVEHNDAVFVEPGQVHPQVTAPGYAMYYLWVIRHLEDNPYLEPEYDPQHLWAAQPDAPIWNGIVND